MVIMAKEGKIDKKRFDLKAKKVYLKMIYDSIVEENQKLMWNPSTNKNKLLKNWKDQAILREKREKVNEALSALSDSKKE